jgi:dTDP-4-dehydrorhamnose reductase
MRIVVTGASGHLGRYLIAGLKDGPHEIVGWSGTFQGDVEGNAVRPVDLTDHRAVARALEDADPDVLIHAAAVSSAEAARRDPGRSLAVNVLATEFLSQWAAARDRRLVYTSTDLVFDGLSSWYAEEDEANPVLVYGQTKYAAERFALAMPRGLVARLSLLYGPSRSGKEGYFDRATTALRAGIPQAFFTDELRTPLHYAIASRILIRLAESETQGLIHVGGPERLSRYDLMRRVALALGIDPLLIQPNVRADVPLVERRPADVSLNSSRLISLFPDLDCPQIEEALSEAG